MLRLVTLAAAVAATFVLVLPASASAPPVGPLPKGPVTLVPDARRDARRGRPAAQGRRSRLAPGARGKLEGAGRGVGSGRRQGRRRRIPRRRSRSRQGRVRAYARRDTQGVRIVDVRRRGDAARLEAGRAVREQVVVSTGASIAGALPKCLTAATRPRPVPGAPEVVPVGVALDRRGACRGRSACRSGTPPSTQTPDRVGEPAPARVVQRDVVQPGDTVGLRVAARRPPRVEPEVMVVAAGATNRMSPVVPTRARRAPR